MKFKVSYVAGIVVVLGILPALDAVPPRISYDRRTLRLLVRGEVYFLGSNFIRALVNEIINLDAWRLRVTRNTREYLLVHSLVRYSV